MSEQVYLKARMFGDGNGMSRQEHDVFLEPAPLPDGRCPDENLLVETGITYHWCSYSSAPKGETEEAQNGGPSDLQGIEESSWEFGGAFYATFERAFQARQQSK